MRTFGIVLVASLFVSCSSSSPGPAPTTTNPQSLEVVIPENADHGGKAFEASLSPVGTLVISINGGQGEVCYGLRGVSAETLTNLTSIHLYTGSVEVNPQILAIGVNTPPRYGCVEGLDPDALRDLARHPADYHVNIYAGGGVVLSGSFTGLKSHQ